MYLLATSEAQAFPTAGVLEIKLSSKMVEQQGVSKMGKCSFFSYTFQNVTYVVKTYLT